MINIRSHQQEREKGFTIVELMIALSVLSVILLTSTLILIQIGSLYSKGVNSANLQNTNRTVVADISGQLQFSGNVPSGCQLNDSTTSPASPTLANSACFTSKHDYTSSADSSTETVYTYCISNTRYTYTMNRELGSDSTTTPTQTTPHVLWRDTLTTDATTCPTMDITKNDPATGVCYDSSGNTACLDKPDSGYEMLGNHMRLTRFVVQEQPASSGIYNVDAWMAFGDSDLVRPVTSGVVIPGQSFCSGGTGTQFCAISSITTQLTGRIY